MLNAALRSLSSASPRGLRFADASVTRSHVHHLRTPLTRAAPLLSSCGKRYIQGGSPAPQPGQPDPTEANPDEDGKSSKNGDESGNDWKGTAFKMFESAATTFASVAILGYVTCMLPRSFSPCWIFNMKSEFFSSPRSFCFIILLYSH